MTKNLSLLMIIMDNKLGGNSEIVLNFELYAHLLAFDIIGDIAFGESFGFLKAGYDHNNLVEILNHRGEWSSTLGNIPWFRPFTPYLIFSSFWTKGSNDKKP